MKIKNLDREVYTLYDLYVHNGISRREFVEKLSTYAVGGITVAALLEYLSPKYAAAQQVRRGDPRLTEEYVTYSSANGGGTIRGLLCAPEGAVEALPGVVVVHENRGLNPHIEDVCRRAALAGFLSLAPDALTPLGGYPGNDDDGRELQRQRDREEMLQDFIAAFAFLRDHERSTGSVGVVGFCFGGWVANTMAVRLPDLGASVPFYGSAPDLAGVPSIEAPLMLHFAEMDTRVNASWPPYSGALAEHSKDFTAHFYEGVQHGFHNDTTPRYNEEAAHLAWKRTISFLSANLR